MQQSPISDHYEAFLEQHSLRGSPAIEDERNVIHWSREAVTAVNGGYGQLSEPQFLQWPAVGLLLNLLHRAFEHLDAAIVNFTTGSAISSEGLSRATVELAVSIRYILAGQPETRVAAFLAHYVDVEERRLRHWQEEVASLSEPARHVHHQEIERRRTWVVATGDLVKRLRQEFTTCGAPPLAETWPNIGERFRAIGESVSYRTFYARMSSQVHSDAEETIRYLVARVGDDAMLAQRMAAETIWFSRLGLYFAAQCFLSASEDYCRCYYMKQAMTRLRAGQRIIEDELRSTATKVMVA